jgi:hypothetical protein
MGNCDCCGNDVAHWICDECGMCVCNGCKVEHLNDFPECREVFWKELPDADAPPSKKEAV